MNIFLLIANLALWVVVLFFGFLLLGALRAVALLRWQVARLDLRGQGVTPWYAPGGRSGFRKGNRELTAAFVGLVFSSG